MIDIHGCYVQGAGLLKTSGPADISSSNNVAVGPAPLIDLDDYTIFRTSGDLLVVRER